MTWLVFVCALAATARLTRFITADDLAEPARAWVEAQFGPGSKLDTLVNCPWCVSIWVAAAAFPLGWHYGGSAPYVWTCAALGASHLVGLAQSNLDGD